MGMMRPRWGRLFGRASRNPARSSAGGNFHVETRADGDESSGYTERVISPQINESVSLRPPGRILRGSVGVRGFRPRVDFEEDLEGVTQNIVNITMPFGRTIEVSYFLEDEEVVAGGIPLTTKDPPHASDGEMWVRIDLTPPTMRIFKGGRLYETYFTDITPGDRQGRYPSRSLRPPFYPSASGPSGSELRGRSPSSVLHPPFYPSRGA